MLRVASDIFSQTEHLHDGEAELGHPLPSWPFPGTALQGHFVLRISGNLLKHSLTAMEEVCEHSFIMTSYLMLRRVKEETAFQIF